MPTEKDHADWSRYDSRVSQWNRQRKWRIFQQYVGVDPEMRILDVGYTDEEFSPTDNFIQKHYPYPQNLTALGVEEPTHFSSRYPDIPVITYDGVTFPFEDQSFDLVWSNAVVEHVGDRDAQLQFIREVARVGRQAFITTPNKRFPVEVHTRTPLLHLLPERVFERYLHLVGKGWATGDYMRMLSAGELRALLAEAGVTNYKLIRNRLAGFTLDFVVVINPRDPAAGTPAG